MPKNNQWYGCKPDIADARDYKFQPKFLWFLPKKIDLRGGMPAVYNQQELGSCVAQAICGAMQYVNMQEGHTSASMSRLFVYYNAREMEGTVELDSGAAVRDGIKSTATHGVCNEDLWPYSIEHFRLKPSAPCYEAAKKERAVTYSRLGSSVRGMCSTLAGGRPFVFGSTLYDGFETDAVAGTGIVHLPEPKEQPVGGHAMLCVGYDDAAKVFIVRNSWGADWGDHGYCYMPYRYLESYNYTMDRWVIQKSS